MQILLYSRNYKSKKLTQKQKAENIEEITKGGQFKILLKQRKQTRLYEV
jgi:hypothetical protein